MRPLERKMEESGYEGVLSALLFIMENPFADKGYEDLKRHYSVLGMTREAEAVEFLLSERSNVNGTNSCQKQRGDD